MKSEDVGLFIVGFLSGNVCMGLVIVAAILL
jgi:hypothetical protein